MPAVSVPLGLALFVPSSAHCFPSLQQKKTAKGKKGASGKGPKKPKKVILKFTIDINDPVEDGIMDPNSFVRRDYC